MDLKNIPFELIDWTKVPETRHAGESGVAVWQTIESDSVRVRIVTYSPGYLADHWCRRGHIVHVLDGELQTEVQGGQTVTLTTGMSYRVGDDLAPHRSATATGARLFIVD